ncbi:MAG TPA: helix-turn-helix transcriptional regulator, partial [Tepidiformaceae bacterium]
MRPTHLETRYKYDLSPRQREVLERIARGKTNAEIAAELGISLDGAKYHVREILAKLNVDSREDAASEWRRMHSPLGRLRHVVLVGMGALPKSGPVLAAVGAAVVVAGVIGLLVLLA